MSHKWNDLKTLSDEQLIAAYDAAAEDTAVGINYYREELVYRQQEKTAAAQLAQATEARALNDRIARFTLWLTIMTAVMVLLTAQMAIAAGP